MLYAIYFFLHYHAVKSEKKCVCLNCMLTTKTMMMNWMRKKTVYCCCRCGRRRYRLFRTLNAAHTNTNTIAKIQWKYPNWNKTTHMYRIHTFDVYLCVLYTLLYTLHTQTHKHSLTSI